MACHVLIRNTLDWELAGPEHLGDAFIREAARLWDDTFRVTYTACRARIKEIALDGFGALRDARIRAGWPRPACDFDTSCFGPDDIVLFCDDDDWYHPHAVEHLQAYASDRDDVLLWPDGVYGFHRPTVEPCLERVRERPLENTRDYAAAVKTNNYAATGRLLHREPRLLHDLWTHAAAIRCLGARRYVREVPVPLSLVNRHPCSYTVLSHVLESVSPAEAGGALRNLVRQYVEGRRTRMQACFEWAADYIERTKAVFREALPETPP